MNVSFQSMFFLQELLKVSKQTWSSSWLSSLEASASSPVASELIVAFPKPLEPPRSASNLQPAFELRHFWCLTRFDGSMCLIFWSEFVCFDCISILWYRGSLLWYLGWSYLIGPMVPSVLCSGTLARPLLIYYMEMEFMVFTLYEQRFSLRKARIRWAILQQLYAHQR